MESLWRTLRDLLRLFKNLIPRDFSEVLKRSISSDTRLITAVKSSDTLVLLTTRFLLGCSSATGSTEAGAAATGAGVAAATSSFAFLEALFLGSAAATGVAGAETAGEAAAAVDCLEDFLDDILYLIYILYL
jgi:hypothetical protein